jgi:MFS family permease
MATAADALIAANPAKPRRRWYTVFALSVAYLIDSMEGYTLQFLWPYMYPALGIPVANLAILQSVGRVVSAITGPIWGYVADRTSRKAILVVMTGIWGLWTAAKGFSNSFSQLLLFATLAGIGLTVLEPAALSLLSDLFDRKERGRAIGFMIAAGFAGSMVSVVILGAIAEGNPDAWRLGFKIIGALSFVSGALLLGINERPRGSAEPEISDVVTAQTAPRIEPRLIPELLRIPTWLFNMISGNIDFMGFAILSAWAFTWIVELDMGPMVQVAMLAMMAGTVLGHLGFGWMSDFVDKRHPARGRVAIGQIGFVINLGAAIGFLVLGNRSVLILSIFGMLFGLSFALKGSGAQLPIEQNVLPPELRATGRAIGSWISAFITAGGVGLSGLLLTRLDNDLQRMMLIMVPIPILVGALTWIPLFRTYPRDVAALAARLTEQRTDMEG